jgi:hypothetical protein
MRRKEKDERLEQIYRLIVTAQRSKAHGGHYKCTYQTAAYLLKVLLGEVVETPLWARELDLPRPLVNVFLRIKTPRGWVSGFERKSKSTK